MLFFPFTTNLTLFLTKTKSSKARSLNKDQWSLHNSHEDPRSLQGVRLHRVRVGRWQRANNCDKNSTLPPPALSLPGGGRVSRTRVHTCPFLTPTEAYEVGGQGHHHCPRGQAYSHHRNPSPHQQALILSTPKSDLVMQLPEEPLYSLSGKRRVYMCGRKASLQSPLPAWKCSATPKCTDRISPELQNPMRVFHFVTSLLLKLCV